VCSKVVARAVPLDEGGHESVQGSLKVDEISRVASAASILDRSPGLTRMGSGPSVYRTLDHAIKGAQ
jgi:hypothetical protein